MLGASSRDICLRGSIDAEGDPVKAPAWQAGSWYETCSAPAFKMMMVYAADCPIRASVISSGGSRPESLAYGLLEMLNGYYIRGIRAMLKK